MVVTPYTLTTLIQVVLCAGYILVAPVMDKIPRRHLAVSTGLVMALSQLVLGIVMQDRSGLVLDQGSVLLQTIFDKICL